MENKRTRNPLGKRKSPVSSHREEVIRLLTQLNERQKTIFTCIDRIDQHLEKLNGKVWDHEKGITVIKTWGAVLLIVTPILINIIMKVI